MMFGDGAEILLTEKEVRGIDLTYFVLSLANYHACVYDVFGWVM